MTDEAFALLRPGISDGSGAGWDLAMFRAACHAMARMVPRTALAACEAPNGGCNHYRAWVDHEGQALMLLLNGAQGLLGFAHAITGYDYRFVDAPALAAAFFGPHEPVAAALLEARIGLHDYERCFSGHELAEVRHWRPERVGEIVFNWWD